LQFAAPNSWKPSPGILGFMQFWRAPDNDHELLMVFRSPRPMQTKDIFSNENMQGTTSDVTVVREQTIKICGTQPATFIQARGSSSRAGPMDIETVATNLGGSSYFAVYLRPASTAPNPAALAALRELCAKP
jgi:hypothetical protein